MLSFAPPPANGGLLGATVLPPSGPWRFLRVGMANAGECNYCASERAVYDLRKQCCAVRIALAHWDVRGSDGVKVLLSALTFFAKDDYIEAVRKEVVRVLRERQ